jgi:hypothetical protein
MSRLVMATTMIWLAAFGWDRLEKFLQDVRAAKQRHKMLKTLMQQKWLGDIMIYMTDAQLYKHYREVI